MYIWICRGLLYDRENLAFNRDMKMEFGLWTFDFFYVLGMTWFTNWTTQY